MGSSVLLYAALGLWITFGRKIAYNNHTPKKLAFFWDKCFMNLRCDLHCQLFQMVFVEIKTTGY